MSHKGFSCVGRAMKPTTNRLGAFIRRRRLALHLSQAELARRCGKHTPYISNIERGKRGRMRLFKTTVKKLARALVCDPFELTACLPETKPKTKLGRFIRARRIELGLTIKELAKRLKIKEEYARAMELNRKCIRPALVSRFARALEIDIESLSRFSYQVSLQKKTSFPLGAFLRARRNELCMTQRGLARRIGVTFQFISAVELGRSPLTRSSKRLKSIMKALNLTDVMLSSVL